MPKSSEKQPLLAGAVVPAKKDKLNTFFKTTALISGLPDGMSKTYPTFGAFAISYNKKGLWLIAPVVSGGLISVGEEGFKLLKEKHPGSNIIKGMEKAAKFGNQVLVGFCEDYGFTMNLIQTLAMQGLAENSGEYSDVKIVAPILAMLIAPSVRLVQYAHINNQNIKYRTLEIVGMTIRGAYSSTFFTELLQQQGVLEETSLIPLAIISITSALAFTSGVLKKNHPKISLVLMALIELISANPSLAAAFFAFPNDIYAASNSENEINDYFFFANAGFTLLYLAMLTLATCKVTKNAWHKNENGPVIEVVDEENQEMRGVLEPANPYESDVEELQDNIEVQHSETSFESDFSEAPVEEFSDATSHSNDLITSDSEEEQQRSETSFESNFSADPVEEERPSSETSFESGFSSSTDELVNYNPRFLSSSLPNVVNNSEYIKISSSL